MKHRRGDLALAPAWRRFAAAITAFALVAAGALGAVSPASAAGGGTITGTVVSSIDGGGLSGIEIDVYSDETLGSLVDFATTDETGAFTVSDLDTGSDYWVNASTEGTPWTGTGAQQVTLSDDVPTASIAFIFEVPLAYTDGGSIHGTVTFPEGFDPGDDLDFGSVSASPVDDGAYNSSSLTDYDPVTRTARYTVGGLTADADYRLQYWSPSGSQIVSTYWSESGGIASYNSATIVQSGLTSRDFGLLLGASITGTVTFPEAFVPTSDEWAYAPLGVLYANSDEFSDLSPSAIVEGFNPDTHTATYTLNALLPASYRLQYQAPTDGNLSLFSGYVTAGGSVSPSFFSPSTFAAPATVDFTVATAATITGVLHLPADFDPGPAPTYLGSISASSVSGGGFGSSTFGTYDPVTRSVPFTVVGLTPGDPVRLSYSPPSGSGLIGGYLSTTGGTVSSYGDAAELTPSASVVDWTITSGVSITGTIHLPADYVWPTFNSPVYVSAVPLTGASTTSSSSWTTGAFDAEQHTVSYTIPGLAPGTYRLSVNRSSDTGPFITGYVMADGTVGASAAAVPVTAPGARDIVLEYGQTITGTVTFPDSFTPGGGFSRFGYVSAVGNGTSSGASFGTYSSATHSVPYTVYGLAPGLYTLSQTSPSGSGLVRNQYWNDSPGGTPDYEGAQLVPAGSAGTDFTVQPGATISGSVHLPAGFFFDDSDLFSGYLETYDAATSDYITGSSPFQRDDANHELDYTIDGLRAGSYKIRYSGTEELEPQWYQDALLQSDATAIVVAPGATASGIDFHPGLGATVTGAVQLPSPLPSTSGYFLVQARVWLGEEVFDAPTVFETVGATVPESGLIPFQMPIRVPASSDYSIEFTAMRAPTGSGVATHTWTATVSGPQVASGVQGTLGTVDLNRASLISGTVTLEDLPAGITYDVRPELYEKSGDEWVPSYAGQTVGGYVFGADHDADYWFGYLPAGTYTVGFAALSTSGGLAPFEYPTVYYGSHASLSDADEIVIDDATTVSGINGTLVPPSTYTPPTPTPTPTGTPSPTPSPTATGTPTPTPTGTPTPSPTPTPTTSLGSFGGTVTLPAGVDFTPGANVGSVFVQSDNPGVYGLASITGYDPATRTGNWTFPNVPVGTTAKFSYFAPKVSTLLLNQWWTGESGGTTSYDAAVSVAAPRTDVHFDVQLGATIAGTVTFPTGFDPGFLITTVGTVALLDPVTGAQVGGTFPVQNYNPTTRTGTFFGVTTAQAVPVGAYKVSVTPALGTTGAGVLYGYAASSLEAADSILLMGGTKTIDLVYPTPAPAGTISGTIHFPAGVALSADNLGRVGAVDGLTMPVGASTISDYDSEAHTAHYEVSGLSGGTFALTYSPPDFFSEHPEQDTRLVPQVWTGEPGGVWTLLSGAFAAASRVASGTGGIDFTILLGGGLAGEVPLPEGFEPDSMGIAGSVELIDPESGQAVGGGSGVYSFDDPTAYSFPGGIPVGQYYLRFSSAPGATGATWYYPDALSLLDAELVTVAPGTVTTADFELPGSTPTSTPTPTAAPTPTPTETPTPSPTPTPTTSLGSFGGTVTLPTGVDFAAGANVGSVFVQSDNPGVYGLASITDYDPETRTGNWTFPNVPVGTTAKFAYFGPKISSPLMRQWWTGTPGGADNSDDGVAAAAPKTDIHFDLKLGGTIAGTVTFPTTFDPGTSALWVANVALVDPASGVPVAGGIPVQNYNSETHTATFNGNGYQIVPAGDYKAIVTPVAGTSGAEPFYAHSSLTLGGADIFTVGGDAATLVDIVYPTSPITAGEISFTPGDAPKVGVGVDVSKGDGWAPDEVTLAYQWYLDETPVGGATESHYLPTADDAGKVLSVRVTGSASGYSSASTTATAGTVGPGTLSPAPVPTISGIAKVDWTLTAVPGTWGPAPVALAYQWSADGTPIGGATGSTYTLAPAQLGKTISVAVTGSKSGYGSVTTTSAASEAVVPGELNAGTPTIAGTATVGETLTAQPGAWSPTPTAFAYEWSADGTPFSTTGSTVVLSAAQLGAEITVKVSATLTGYTTANATSAPVGPVAAATFSPAPVPVINGALTVGSTLIANAGTWGPAPVALAYQWLADGAGIDGATGQTFTLTPAQLGTAISVEVTGSKVGYLTTPRTSGATGIVSAGDLSPTPVPTVTGTGKVGTTLEGSSGAWGPGAPTLSYAWFQGATQVGTGSQLLVTSALYDTGLPVTLRVTGTLTGYTTVTVASAPVDVEAGDLTVGSSSISGIAQVGQTLSAGADGWGPAPVALAYQWSADGTPIGGATGSTFTLTAAQLGKTVAVAVTGSKAGYGSVTKASSPSAAVGPGDFSPGTPTIAGTATVGETLTAQPGTWSPTPTAFAYEWSADGVPFSTSGSTVVLSAAQIDAEITVKVSATLTGYTTANATSAPVGPVADATSIFGVVYLPDGYLPTDPDSIGTIYASPLTGSDPTLAGSLVDYDESTNSAHYGITGASAGIEYELSFTATSQSDSLLSQFWNGTTYGTPLWSDAAPVLAPSASPRDFHLEAGFHVTGTITFPDGFVPAPGLQPGGVYAERTAGDNGVSFNSSTSEFDEATHTAQYSVGPLRFGDSYFLHYWAPSEGSVGLLGGYATSDASLTPNSYSGSAAAFSGPAVKDFSVAAASQIEGVLHFPTSYTPDPADSATYGTISTEFGSGSVSWGAYVSGTNSVPFSVGGLAPGVAVRLQYAPPSGSSLIGGYLTAAGTTGDSSSAVQLTPPALGVGWTLGTGAGISGTISLPDDFDWPGYLPGVSFFASPLSGFGSPGSVAWGAYDADTHTVAYSLSGLAPGQYRLQVSTFGGPFLGGYWTPAGLTPSYSSAALVSAPATGVDFELTRGLTISGTVTFPAGYAPTTSFSLQASGSLGGFGSATFGTPSGQTLPYTISGLSPDTYQILATSNPANVGPQFPFRGGYWSPAGLVADFADGVTVAAPQAGVDFSFVVGDTISGALEFPVGYTPEIATPNYSVNVDGAGFAATKFGAFDSGTGELPYTVYGLYPGTYQVRLNSWTGSISGIPIPAFPFRTGYWSESDGVVRWAEEATPVAAPRSDVDFPLVLGATISGTIHFPESFSPGGFSPYGSVFADDGVYGGTGSATGYDPSTRTATYEVTGLWPGEFKLRWSGSGSGIVSSQYWTGTAGGAADSSGAVPIHVVDDADADFFVQEDARISGTVDLPDGASAVSGTVAVYGPNGSTVGVGTVDSTTGAYTVPGLRAGTYTVKFTVGGGVESQWYDDELLGADALPVTISTGEHRTGVNFAPPLGATLSATLQLPAPPVSGHSYDIQGVVKVGDETYFTMLASVPDATGAATISLPVPGTHPYSVRFTAIERTPGSSSIPVASWLTTVPAGPTLGAGGSGSLGVVALAPAGSIQGSVSFEGLPPTIGHWVYVPQATVYRLTDGTWSSFADASATSRGDATTATDNVVPYWTGLLPSGTYTVGFTAISTGSGLVGPLDYPETFVGGVSTPEAAQHFVVSAGDQFTGADVTLVPEGDELELSPTPVPTISGTAKVGSTLNVNRGTWGPDGVALTQQWFADDQAIDGATGATLVLTPDLVGKVIAVRVTGSLVGYAPVTVQSSPVTAQAGDLTAGSPSMTGSAQVGQTLSVAPGAWDPSPVAFSYQWLAGGSPIVGATGDSLELGVAQLGAAISVEVTGSKAGYATQTVSAGPTAAVLPGTLSPSPVPTIGGTAKVGSTLTVTRGTWGPGEVALTQQWFAGGEAITEATGTTLVLTPDLVDDVITVRVTGTLAGYTTTTRTSVPTSAVLAGTIAVTTAPVVSGTHVFGGTLSATAGSFTPVASQVTIGWFIGSAAIATETDTLVSADQTASFTPPASAVGQTIHVEWTASRPGYADATGSTTAVSFAAATFESTPPPGTSGSGKVGTTLAVIAPTWVPGASFAYEWFRGATSIGTGPTSPVLTVSDLQSGQVVTVRATGTLAGYAPVTVTSPSVTVQAGDLSVGSPSITGTAAVGETLTALPGTWSPTPAFSYEWSADGTPFSTTGSTVVLGIAQLGAQITVKVSGTLTGYTTANATSAPVGPVVVAALSPAPVPVISGALSVGSTLTANAGTWGPAPVALAYQWLAGGAAIDGATGSTLTLTPAQLGAAISVEVTGSKIGYTSTTRTSGATTAIAAGDLAPTPVPTISGTAKVGSTLTLIAGTWGPGEVTLIPNWYKNGAPITIATGLSRYELELTPDLAGATITANVLGIRAGYHSVTTNSLPIGPVASGDLAPTPVPTVTGSGKVGTTLAAVPGVWGPGAPTLSYAWFQGATQVGTGSELLVTPALYATGLPVTLRVTGALAGYTTKSETSVSVALVRGDLGVGTPTVTGTPQVGGTLAVNAGSWTPAPVALAYRWSVDGYAIPGSAGSGSSFIVQPSYLGKPISVTVTGSAAGYVTATAAASAGEVGPGTLSGGSVVVSGTVKVGSSVSASVTPGIGWPSGVALGYQWFAGDSPIPGATGASLVIPSSAAGTTLVVHVTATKATYTALPLEASAGVVGVGILAAPASVSVVGTAQVGQQLSAVAGSWPVGTALAYQWRSGGAPIDGATGTTFDLSPSEIGASISVSVTGSLTGYGPATVTSAPTASVAAAPLALFDATPTPTIAGAAVFGQTLTATLGTWSPTPDVLGIQWLANGSPIPGATSATLTLGVSQIGTAISVRATGAKAGYGTTPRSSSPTAIVVAATLTSTPTPTISGASGGEVQVGGVLSVTTGSWAPAPVALGYQWSASGAPISGATGSQLIVGPTIPTGALITVTVTGSRSGYTSDSQTSASVTVAAPYVPPQPTAETPNVNLNLAPTGKTSVVTLPDYVPDAKVTLPNVTDGATPSTTLGSPIVLARQSAEAETTAVVTLPSGTSITGPTGWNGAITPPTIVSETVPLPSTPLVVIEVGLADQQLSFDQPVRLVLPGQGAPGSTLVIGYATGGVFHQMESCLSGSADGAPSPLADACYFRSNGDLVIWTTHFTQFLAYVPPAAPPVPDDEGGGASGGAPSTGGGSSGTGSIGSAVAAPGSAPIATAAPKPPAGSGATTSSGSDSSDSGTNGVEPTPEPQAIVATEAGLPFWAWIIIAAAILIAAIAIGFVVLRARRA